MCCADFESLRDGGTPTAADAVCRYDLSRENAMPGGPQTARHCSIKIIFPLFMPKAHAAGILICYILIFCAARAMDASRATSRFSSIWPQ